MSFLEVDQVSKMNDGNVVLNRVSLHMRQMEHIAVAGETGSGKSTLLRIIAGLIQPDAGSVVFQGNQVDGPLDKLVPGHKQIAYLSQQFELPKFLRVEQILSYADTLSDDMSASLFDVCEIAHLLKRKSDQLSGGERQRIALAKLLIGQPKLLLLDEPFSNLDIIHKNTLQNVITNISNQMGITCVLVSHDPLDTLSWADRILVLRAGETIALDTPRNLYYHPVDRYAAGLFGRFNFIDRSAADAMGWNGKTDFFTRPEHMEMKMSDDGQALVSAVRFYGAFKEAEVLLNDTTYFVRNGADAAMPGKKVSIILNQDALMKDGVM